MFLDVEMPEHMGTQIMDFFDESEIDFKIVFTMAHSEYAVKAFEINAVDYLLKPLRPNEVKEAGYKIHSRNQTNVIGGAAF